MPVIPTIFEQENRTWSEQLGPGWKPVENDQMQEYVDTFNREILPEMEALDKDRIRDYAEMRNVVLM